MQRTPAGVLHYRWNALGYTRSRSGCVMAALGRKRTLPPPLPACPAERPQSARSEHHAYLLKM